MAIAKVIILLAAFIILTSASETTPSPDKEYDHYVIDVPFKFDNVHYIAVKKAPLYKAPVYKAPVHKGWNRFYGYK